MAPEEKRTYLPYSRGIDPKRLRIGNLVLDPYNPTTGLETKRLKYRDRASQEEYWEAIQEWAGDAQLDRPCSLQFEASHEWSIAAAIIDAVHADVERQGANHAVIEGRNGRRFEIEEPLRFFKEEVFNQPGTQDWIRKQVSISFPARMKTKLKHKDGSWRAPDIWLCTGIQLISGGRVRAGASHGASQGAGAKFDPGMVQGVPTGQTAVGIDASHSTSNQASNNYSHADERVWAAQFYRLEVEFGKAPPQDPRAVQNTTGITKMLEKPMLINLRDLEDLKAGAIRDDDVDTDGDSEIGDEPGSNVAEIVGLVKADTITNNQRSSNSGDSDKKDINVDNRPYTEAMDDVDWIMYEKYCKYWDKLVSYDR